MPLIEVKCKNCGSSLHIDSNTKTGVCPFCNTQYFSEDTVNNYNIGQANIHIDNNAIVENLLKNAETNLSILKDYEKSAELFKKVTESAPDNYKGWWGIIRAKTREFHNFDSSTLNQLNKYAAYAINVAGTNTKTALKDKWLKYLIKNKAILQGKIDSLDNDCKKFNNTKLNTTKKLQPIIKQKEEILEKYQLPLKLSNGVLFVFIIITLTYIIFGTLDNEMYPATIISLIAMVITIICIVISRKKRILAENLIEPINSEINKTEDEISKLQKEIDTAKSQISNLQAEINLINTYINI